jgi:hypothetical protein
MNQKYKYMVVALGGLLLNGLALYLIWQFLYMPIRNAHESLTTAESQLKELEKKSRLVKELEQTLEKRKTDLERVASVFLTSDTVVPFLQTLENIAARTGVELEIPSSAKLGDGSPSNQRSIFDLNLVGNFPNQLAFLQLLENAPYDVAISRLETSTSLEGTQMQIHIGVLTAQKQ